MITPVFLTEDDSEGTKHPSEEIECHSCDWRDKNNWATEHIMDYCYDEITQQKQLQGKSFYFHLHFKTEESILGI